MKLWLAYFYLKQLNKKYPEFDKTKYIPLTQRYPDKSVKELWKIVSKE